jgi:hypothetical protein
MQPPTTALEELLVADTLACDAPVNESWNEYRRVDTALLANDQPSLPNCLGEAPAPGSDAFFAVDMRAGQRWHFHVKVASAAVDPAIYVLDSCSDSRSCQDTYFGINACAEGENEHFSFVAPMDNRYYVGIDSLLPGSEPMEVWAVHADCGNLSREHGEYCDDGNEDPLDGCHQCRPVLLADRAEVEPNDGPLDSNFVRLQPDALGQRRINGTLGSRCDFDFYQVEIPPGAEARITLTGESECGRIDLQLRTPGDPNPFGAGDPSDENPCVLERKDLAPGNHLVRVASRRDPGTDFTTLDYGLEIDVRERAPE